MIKYLDARYILLVAVLLCFFFIAVQADSANASHLDAKKGNPPSKSISDLKRKVFRITTVNGKQTMTLITGYSGEPTAQKWWADGYAKPCVNNVAMLNRIDAATEIKGTSTILAFLDCPAANDGGAASIVTLFESANTDVPVCFSHIQLMDDSGNYYWGAVRSIDVRKLHDNNFIVVPTLAGGDAGDSWVSYSFLHMDSKCDIKLLSKFYASMHNDTDDENKCEGERHSYKFVNDSTIEIRRDKLLCTKTGERTVETKIKRLDLNVLLERPDQRIFEP